MSNPATSTNIPATEFRALLCCKSPAIAYDQNDVGEHRKTCTSCGCTSGFYVKKSNTDYWWPESVRLRLEAA
jgi:hypothetical protein